ncbi:hypothetical protein BGZ95_010987 [Linnemannia exigua]|uniref:CMP/dCMP-type deaminase domain-containing protein n=1 Tax=Linnemannia exigua TaxID=604196 RepID=A0AAD4DAI3_9FUNG|nr:hypothetical protein BGZ95_010987 [Linnemannia exigua]
MKLAIEQANLSIPVPSGYCVGAVLVQETLREANTNNNRRNNLHNNNSSSSNGIGNDYDDEENVSSQEFEEDKDEGYADRFRVVVTGYSRELPGNTHAEECCLLKLAALGADTGSRDDYFESDHESEEMEKSAEGVDDGVREEGGSIANAGGATGSGAGATGCHNGSGQYNTTKSNNMNGGRKLKSRRKWIMYSTMEPCSTRLSGNRSCSDRLIASGIRQVYVGVREPDHFVKTVVGVENMVEKGIEVIHIPGLEEECLAPNRHVLAL